MSERYALLIVGGGPAGLSAARSYRHAGGAGLVAIVTDEHRMPYQRPPLTKELLRDESSEAELPIEDESWLDRAGVTLISGRGVALDGDRRTVTLSGARELAYEQCVLATGGEPKRLPVPGADHPRVRVIRTLDHLRELLQRLHRPDPLIVIGSGFIGCEIASSLRARGHPVSLVSDESSPNEARLGAAAAEAIREWLADDGIELHLGTPVERIEPADGHVMVCTEDGTLTGAIAVMASGIAPRTELALDAGIALEDGAIPTNAAMRTARYGVLAAGDVCVADNAAAGRKLRVEHWGDALAQGEVAGRTAAGEDAVWNEVPGFWSTIGKRTLKYAAWGDGFDQDELERHDGGGFTVRYGRGGALVGVLTHESDSDYERASELIKRREPWRRS